MKRVIISAIIFFLPVSLITSPVLVAQGIASAEQSVQLRDDIQDSPSEDMFLHIDRDRFIAGEDIWFSIYNIDRQTGKLSEISSVAYVELLNPWNVPVIQKRLQLTGGLSEGNIFLSDTLSSGTYTVRAYTNRMKSFLPENCFMGDVEIFNPFGNTSFMLKEGSVNKLKFKDNDNRTEEKGRVSLVSDSIFGRREKVTLKIRNDKDDEGQSDNSVISISVAPSIVSEGLQGINDYFLSKKSEWPEKISETGTFPGYNSERDGHYLSVLIKYRETGVSDSTDYLYMSTQGKVAEFRYAGIDKSGRFNFILPIDSKLRNLIIQPEHASDNMILGIEPSFSRILPVSNWIRDTLNDSRIRVFSELSFNYQASKIYDTKLKKEVLTIDDKDQKKRRFYGIPELEIILDDYIMLPSMQEVFFELIPGVIIRSLKSGFEMKIINPLTGAYYNEPPLVMIDGVIINDLKVLVDLNPETVEKVEVVKTPYLIGDLILHGIVNVITRSGDFSSITMPDYAVILAYRVIDIPYSIMLPDYSDEKNRQSRRPDLRNTLYWNPSVKTGSNQESVIEFWTSDLPGVYTISIQGISGSGEKISLNRSFRIR